MTQNRLKPQKAEDADLAKIRFPAICQPKIDGVRAPYLGQTLTSRTLTQFRNTAVTRTFNDPLMQGLDGELAYGEINKPGLCARTQGLVNSYASNTNGDIPDWYIFDFVTPNSYHLPYKQRWENAKVIVNRLAHPKVILVPRATVVNSLEEVLAYHIEVIACGFEGTIIRFVGGPHKSGRSTVNEGYYLRLKDFADAEGTITKIFEGEHNLNEATRGNAGQLKRSSAQANKIGNQMVGSLEVTFPAGTIKAKPELTSGIISAGSLTHKERAEFWEFPQRILNRRCTFTFMVYGMKDKLRFPQFKSFRDGADE